MNIFILDDCPDKAAIQQLDKHVVKMPLETAQMLCSALVRHGCEGTPYKAAYRKHPCTIWAGDTRTNFLWLIKHGVALSQEYTARYGRRHKSQDVIEWCATQAHLIPSGQLTEFAQAMPDHYKNPCPVTAYRSYYLGDKARIATWKRNQPEWWIN
jgi:hypothetical protein